MTKRSTLDWVEVVLENAPAGIGTLVQLKNLFGEVYHELRSEYGGDLPLDELRAKLKEKIASLRETQDEINKID